MQRLKRTGCERRLARLIACRPKPNGNTPVERERQPHFISGPRSASSKPTTMATSSMAGDKKACIGKRLSKLASFQPILGGCTTCTVTSGNGPVPSMTKNMGVPSCVLSATAIPAVLGCCGAVRGTTTRGGCGRPLATGTSRATGTTAWDFVLPGP